MPRPPHVPLDANTNADPGRLAALHALRVILPRSDLEKHGSRVRTLFYTLVRRWALENTSDDPGEIQPIDRGSAIELGMHLFMLIPIDQPAVNVILDQADVSDAMKQVVLAAQGFGVRVTPDTESPSMATITMEIVDNAGRMFYRKNDPALVPLRAVWTPDPLEEPLRHARVPRTVIQTEPQADSVVRALHWLHAPDGTTEELALATMEQPSLLWYQVPYRNATLKGARAVAAWLGASTDAAGFLALTSINALYQRLIDASQDTDGDDVARALIPATTAGSAAYPAGSLRLSRTSGANARRAFAIFSKPSVTQQAHDAFARERAAARDELRGILVRDIADLERDVPGGTFHQEVLSAVRGSHDHLLENLSKSAARLFEAAKEHRQLTTDTSVALGKLQQQDDDEPVFDGALSNIQPLYGTYDFVDNIRQAAALGSASGRVTVYTPDNKNFLKTPAFAVRLREIIGTSADPSVRVHVIVGSSTAAASLRWGGTQELAHVVLYFGRDVRPRAVYIIHRDDPTKATGLTKVYVDAMMIADEPESSQDQAMLVFLRGLYMTPSQLAAAGGSGVTPKAETVRAFLAWPETQKWSRDLALLWGIWFVHAAVQGLRFSHIRRTIVELMGPGFLSYVSRGDYAKRIQTLLDVS